MRDDQNDDLRDDLEEENEPERRGNWYLLTGLVIGLVIGILYSWVVSPVRYVDTDPSSLAPVYKDEYRRVIALSYHANGNIDRAKERLALLDTTNSIQILAAQAQRMVAENQLPNEARMLALLAADLGPPPSVVTSSPPEVAEQPTEGENQQAEQPTEAATLEIAAAVQTPTIPLPTLTPTITRTPIPTFTPRPTATPMRVLDSPFVLKERREICDGSVPAGMLQVQVTGEDGEPLPGVRIVVTWSEGEESFYTGLVPEVTPGFSDFQMTPGVFYNLKIGNASEPIDGLSASGMCGVRLEFSQEKGS